MGRNLKAYNCFSIKFTSHYNPASSLSDILFRLRNVHKWYGPSIVDRGCSVQWHGALFPKIQLCLSCRSISALNSMIKSSFPGLKGSERAFKIKLINFISLLLIFLFQNDFSPQHSRSSLISILRRRFQLKHSVTILLDIRSTLCNPATNSKSFLLEIFNWPDSVGLQLLFDPGLSSSLGIRLFGSHSGYESVIMLALKFLPLMAMLPWAVSQMDDSAPGRASWLKVYPPYLLSFRLCCTLLGKHAICEQLLWRHCLPLQWTRLPECTLTWHQSQFDSVESHC